MINGIDNQVENMEHESYDIDLHAIEQYQFHSGISQYERFMRQARLRGHNRKEIKDIEYNERKDIEFNERNWGG